jgi:GAF domain-containing protein
LSGSDQKNLLEVTGRSAESLEILARALHVKNAELQPTLEAIAATAVTMLSPARYAGLIILARGELIPRATTGEPPQDDRWPEFCAEAARLKVRSMLCVPLWVDERGLGALSLYADQAAAFSDLHERVTVLLATFAALALAEAQRADQLHDALGNRDVIGQAKGILMERHGVTATAAFGVLSRVSQAENMKLAEIARRFVETGELPGLPGSTAAAAMP